MGSVPPMYLIIALEQHGPAAQSLYLAIGKVGICFFCICLYLSGCLPEFLSVLLCLLLWLTSFSPSFQFTILSHFSKKIGSFSVYIKSVTMVTKAACKHLHSQLSPFLRHLGLCAFSCPQTFLFSFYTCKYFQPNTYFTWSMWWQECAISDKLFMPNEWSSDFIYFFLPLNIENTPDIYFFTC